MNLEEQPVEVEDQSVLQCVRLDVARCGARGFDVPICLVDAFDGVRLLAPLEHALRPPLLERELVPEMQHRNVFLHEKVELRCHLQANQNRGSESQFRDSRRSFRDMGSEEGSRAA